MLRNTDKLVTTEADANLHLLIKGLHGVAPLLLCTCQASFSTCVHTAQPLSSVALRTERWLECSICFCCCDKQSWPCGTVWGLVACQAQGSGLQVDSACTSCRQLPWQRRETATPCLHLSTDPNAWCLVLLWTAHSLSDEAVVWRMLHHLIVSQLALKLFLAN